MLEAARVIRIEENTVFVNIVNITLCSQCIMGNRCPFNSNTKYQIQIPKPKDLNIKEGDYIEFETPKKLNATKLSILLYGIPIIIFVGGVLFLLDLTKLGNFWSLGISLIGTTIYYSILTLYTKKYKERFLPHIVKKIDV